MRFHVEISRREGLADPEGAATLRALHDLGYDDVTGVHFGRTITLDIEGADEDAALVRITEMCERLLANPVIEGYSIDSAG